MSGATTRRVDIGFSLARTRRDFRISVGLLLAGVLIVVGFYGYFFWRFSSATYSATVSDAVLENLIGGIGSTLLLVGAIFTAINWSLLRQADRPIL
ncbi:MAG TPA: hypothetical protein VML94_07795 [Thermoplasmata archaeon]|nr:hypothetical protein [Thermoplasmata archaeon]